jgi:hypothetical protein
MADWPRWMEEGSAVSVAVGGVAGGGGGTLFVLFLQPLANVSVAIAPRIKIQFLLL